MFLISESRVNRNNTINNLRKATKEAGEDKDVRDCAEHVGEAVVGQIEVEGEGRRVQRVEVALGEYVLGEARGQVGFLGRVR